MIKLNTLPSKTIYPPTIRIIIKRFLMITLESQSNNEKKKKRKKAWKRFFLSAKIIIVCVRGFRAFCEMKEQSADWFVSQVFYIVSQLVATSTCGIVSRWPTCQVGLTMNNIDTFPHRVSNVFLFSMPKRAWNRGPDQIMLCYYIWDFLTSLNPYPSPRRSVIYFHFAESYSKVD